MSKQETNFRQLLDKRFGMFVHFGLYSAFAGYYNGKRIDGLGEWIMRNAQIPIEEYEAYGISHFCPSPGFAQSLVKQAKKAGIQFIVMTSKHHDGFCLFKSAVSDYTTHHFYGRDLCKELADACHEEGLELGLYYSHALDWHEKNAAGNYCVYNGIYTHHRNYWDFPDDDIDFDKYLEEKCFPQVKELLTNYGELKLIWFDYPHDITKKQSERLRKLVKSIQPECLINSRIAHNLNDYESLGDNALPSVPVGENIECLITLNDTWGYCKDDQNWKSSADTLDTLCRTLNSDATLLLNVGPKADGSLTPETIQILNEMGEWTKRNREAVYGRLTGNPFPVIFGWGYVALKDNVLYMYIKDSKKKKIVLPGIRGNIRTVSLVGMECEVDYQQKENELIIYPVDSNFVMPVYKIVFEEKPVISDEIGLCDDRVSLGVRWAKKVRKGHEKSEAEALYFEKSAYIESRGTHGLCINENVLTDFWVDSEELLCWDARFDKAGFYEATVVHGITYTDASCSTLSKGSFSLEVAAQCNPVDMEREKGRFRNSKTGEDNIRICRDAGTFVIEKPGRYRIILAHDGQGDSFLFSNIEFVMVESLK